MKKALILILVFLFAASLPGCAARPSPEAPAENGSDKTQHGEAQTPAPGGPSPEAEGPLSDPEPVGYESRGYVLSLPGDCAGSILVNPADGPEDMEIPAEDMEIPAEYTGDPAEETEIPAEDEEPEKEDPEASSRQDQEH